MVVSVPSLPVPYVPMHRALMCIYVTALLLCRDGQVWASHPRVSGTEIPICKDAVTLPVTTFSYGWLSAVCCNVYK